ncbi:hypothetical protein PFISCL1PPCAC_10868, partial [Pristionchus fissidentatus]
PLTGSPGSLSISAQQSLIRVTQFWIGRFIETDHFECLDCSVRHGEWTRSETRSWREENQFGCLMKSPRDCVSFIVVSDGYESFLSESSFESVPFITDSELINSLSPCIIHYEFGFLQLAFSPHKCEFVHESKRKSIEIIYSLLILFWFHQSLESSVKEWIIS